MILVDTHAAIWLTQDRSKLSHKAQRALVAARKAGGVAIADITLHEIALLVARGRVAVSTTLDVYLAFVESIFKVLPIDARIAARSEQFGRGYPRDPADRLIGATALVHGMALVTKDESIRDSGEVKCIW